jgi:hypothetical protein
MSNEFMAEFNRLVRELIHAAHDTIIDEDQTDEDAAQAALVAHVERGVLCLCKAELDAADPACYPQAEIMDNNATVGEVPMPMPHIAGELFDGTRFCAEEDVRTYGQQCHAAGYAAGVAAERELALGAPK